MQSVLPTVLIVLSLQRVGCSRSSGPTALPTSDNPMAPAPTPAPLRRAHLEEHNAPPCAQLSGDASVSDYTFNCPAGQTCLIIATEFKYWGCCKEVPNPVCPELNCPVYSSCIGSTALASCNSDCMTDPGVLKCSGSAKPFCALGRASMSIPTDMLSISEILTMTFTTLSQYACAGYPYTLNYTVFVNNMGFTERDCAPDWIDNPTSLEAWSKTVASEISAATIQDFANPFDQVVARANFSASTVLPFINSTTTPPPTVLIPTAPSVTSTTATSASVRWAVSLRKGMYIFALVLTRQFFLS